MCLRSEQENCLQLFASEKVGIFNFEKKFFLRNNLLMAQYKLSQSQFQCFYLVRHSWCVNEFYFTKNVLNVLLQLSIHCLFAVTVIFDICALIYYVLLQLSIHCLFAVTVIFDICALIYYVLSLVNCSLINENKTFFQTSV